MITTKGKVLRDINHYKKLKSSLKHLGEQIHKEACYLLKEMQKVEDWQCIVKEINLHNSPIMQESFLCNEQQEIKEKELTELENLIENMKIIGLWKNLQ